MKVFERRGAFRVIPRIGEENSSNVPKDGVNFRHRDLLSPLVIPSRSLARNLLSIS
jgi:hypothetical protein